MTVLRFNSIFTPSLFLVVKLIQMAMFPHRYPDTIKLYVVPNLTMFRFCSHNVLCYNHCNYFCFYNFLPCIKCSARASVIPGLAHLKIVR